MHNSFSLKSFDEEDYISLLIYHVESCELFVIKKSNSNDKTILKLTEREKTK